MKSGNREGKRKKEKVKSKKSKTPMKSGEKVESRPRVGTMKSGEKACHGAGVGKSKKHATAQAWWANK